MGIRRDGIITAEGLIRPYIRTTPVFSLDPTDASADFSIDARLSLRFDSSEIGNNMSEILAYGTGVVVVSAS